MLEYAALVVSPRALPDGLILVFQHPVRTIINTNRALIVQSRVTGAAHFRKPSVAWNRNKGRSCSGADAAISALRWTARCRKTGRRRYTFIRRIPAANQMKTIRDSIQPQTFAGGIERMTPLHPRRIRMPDCMDRGKNNELSFAALSVHW